MRFDEWLNRFISGKEEVADFKLAEAYPVHSARQFVDKHNSRYWEIAFTYTGRLVVRSGLPSSQGRSIDWGQWETQHDVILSMSLEQDKENRARC